MYTKVKGREKCSESSKEREKGSLRVKPSENILLSTPFRLLEMVGNAFSLYSCSSISVEDRL